MIIPRQPRWFRWTQTGFFQGLALPAPLWQLPRKGHPGMLLSTRSHWSGRHPGAGSSTGSPQKGPPLLGWLAPGGLLRPLCWPRDPSGLQLNVCAGSMERPCPVDTLPVLAWPEGVCLLVCKAPCPASGGEGAFAISLELAAVSWILKRGLRSARGWKRLRNWQGRAK